MPATVGENAALRQRPDRRITNHPFAFYTMEYVAGGTLDHFWRSFASVPILFRFRPVVNPAAGRLAGRCLVWVGGVLRASLLTIVGCVYFSGKIGRTGQNRTFPDIVGLGGVGRGFGHDGGRVDHDAPPSGFLSTGVLS